MEGHQDEELKSLRGAERVLFWYERILILAAILYLGFSSLSQSYRRVFVFPVLELLFAIAAHLFIFLKRQHIYRNFSFASFCVNKYCRDYMQKMSLQYEESERNFWAERVGMLLILLPYLGLNVAYARVFGVAILMITNFFRVLCYALRSFSSPNRPTETASPKIFPVHSAETKESKVQTKPSLHDRLIDSLHNRLESLDRTDRFEKVAQEFMSEAKAFFRKMKPLMDQNLYLQAKLEAVHNGLEAERLDWDQEREQLYAKLEIAEVSLQTYRDNQKSYAEERQKWEEEKASLNAAINEVHNWCAQELYDRTVELDEAVLCWRFLEDRCRELEEEKEKLEELAFHTVILEGDVGVGIQVPQWIAQF